MIRTLSILLLTFAIVTVSFAQQNPPKESVVDRFLRYVKIDTQAAEGVDTTPSTKKQFDLANLLVKELKELGGQNVRVNEFAIVYAEFPGNLPDNSKVPVIGLIAHMDTSPDVSGANVNPIIHKNYQGGDIVLPNDKTQVIRFDENPALKNLIGEDIITADGTTLLGSDDKAGIAEIMTMLDILRQNPSIKRGDLRIAFTPDEEIGLGIAKFDVEAFGAQFAYTVDGGELGEISTETWSARVATVTFNGFNVHPGYAKDKMVNSAYAAAHFLSSFPADMLPESTEGRVGFIHPYGGTMDTETSSIRILLRDFEIDGLEAKEEHIKKMIAVTQAKFPKVKIDYEVRDQYLNMNEILKKYPQLAENAMEASRRAGVEPRIKPIRGGTDGSQLTFRNLPTPNIYTGGSNFHSKLEFNSVKGLTKSTEMLVHLVQVWAESGK